MKRILAVMAFAAVIQGCSGVSVKQDYDPAANFTGLKTYAWQSEKQKETGNVLTDNSLIDARVRNAVDTALARKGYRKVDAGQADYLVAYSYTVEDKIELDRTGTSVGVGVGTGRHHHSSVGFGFGFGTRDYEENTLLIDTINPASGKLIWRGFARQRLIWRSDPEKTTAKIHATVDAILNKFPPKNKR
jgi:hypothetical protein